MRADDLMISSTFLYQKKKPPLFAKLSLVSLMDIFTILVFFLLLNSGESENVAYAKFVELPNSATGTSPHKELIVLIGKEDIRLGDTIVAKVSDILKDPDHSIKPLVAALTEYSEKRGVSSGFEKQNGFAITIMGDKSVSYSLLKSVMATCRQQNYRNISLAVNQVVSGNYSGTNTQAMKKFANPAGSEG
jgi:biopolymer transport protein ExbD